MTRDFFFIAMAAFVVAACSPADPADSDALDSHDYAVHTADADRFAAIFNRTEGKPSADDLRSGYLDGAGRGVEVFTPGRIVDAENLARAVSNDPDRYRRAVDVCLPLVKNTNAELNQIYTRMAALLPGRNMPEVHTVFGAGNSGGTEADIRAGLRTLYAYETVHSLQGEPDISAFLRDPMLFMAVMEGVADYVALQVVDDLPRTDRDVWASARAERVRADFMADRALIRAAIRDGHSFDTPTPEMSAAFGRWFGNHGNPPEGWPSELGYLVGRKIAEGFAQNAGEGDQTLDVLVGMESPDDILARSKY